MTKIKQAKFYDSDSDCEKLQVMTFSDVNHKLSRLDFNYNDEENDDEDENLGPDYEDFQDKDSDLEEKNE